MSGHPSLQLRVVEDGALYAAQPKIYPREVDGRFARLRSAAVFALLGLYYVLPWLSIGAQQLVLFDLPARRFYVFGLTFWPQDFFLLTLLLVTAAVSLFFFTALAGRLWCGYACPQTVWTEVFLWIERKVEGNRNRRMKRDSGAWTRERIGRAALKQTLWIAFALWTGFTFVGFFTPIRALAGEVIAVRASGWESFWILFYSFATYGNAGYLREQVCKYMCPYARFQSAMFDRDTLVVSYDAMRGEPRGGRRRNADRSALGLGDCIDCDACVQVCPTGIDIRNGLQIECIACAGCIDVCDSVMDKMGYPRGLIRYTTENMLAGGPRRIVRPRTLIYAAILLGIVSAFVALVAMRASVLVEVVRDRKALYRLLADGAIENSYSLRLVNKTDRPASLAFDIAADFPVAIVGSTRVALDANEIANVPLTLRAPASDMHGRRSLTLAVRAADSADRHERPLASTALQYFTPESK